MMSKGSHINVGSIEEAIEILKNAIRCNEKQFEELGTHILLQDDEEEAIKIVLGNLEALCDMQKSADRELQRQKQINEEHQKINGELREKVKELEEENMQKDLEIIGKEEYIEANMKEIISQYYTANEDCIPKQKIKDKIEILKMEEHYDYLNNKKTIEILQELLQESEE